MKTGALGAIEGLAFRVFLFITFFVFVYFLAHAKSSLTSVAGLVESLKFFGVIFGLEAASAIIGAFLGFLFGIPHSLQHAAGQAASGAETKVEMNASTAKGLNDTKARMPLMRLADFSLAIQTLKKFLIGSQK